MLKPILGLYWRVEVKQYPTHADRLCSDSPGLSGICMVFLIAIIQAKARPLLAMPFTDLCSTMEAVGLAASITALLELTKRVIEYGKDAKDANEEWRKLFDEISATGKILEKLESKANDNDWKDTISALNTPQGSFDQFRVTLKRVESKVKPVDGKFTKVSKSDLVFHDRRSQRNSFET
jgi:hypothetical protein